MEHGSRPISAPQTHPDRKMKVFWTAKELENFKPTNQREELKYGRFPKLRAFIQPKSSGERSFGYRGNRERAPKVTFSYEIGLAAAHIKAMECAILDADGHDFRAERKAKKAAEDVARSSKRKPRRQTGSKPYPTDLYKTPGGAGYGRPRLTRSRTSCTTWLPQSSAGGAYPRFPRKRVVHFFQVNGPRRPRRHGEPSPILGERALCFCNRP